MVLEPFGRSSWPLGSIPEHQKVKIPFAICRWHPPLASPRFNDRHGGLPLGQARRLDSREL
jgi:hypothetical protein